MCEDQMGSGDDSAAARAVHDQLAMQEIDQLHAVTLAFSRRTLESKRMAVTLIAAVAGIVLVVTEDKLTPALFFLLVAVLLLSWLYDAYNYHYQATARYQMKKIQQTMLNRYELPAGDGVGLPLKPEAQLRWKALINWSQTWYLGLGIVIVVLWSFFELGELRG